MQGNICLDILKEKWSAAYSVRTILLSIQAWTASSQQLIQYCLPHVQRTYANLCMTLVLPAQSLLGEPNNESPLNVHAAQLWSNQKAFRSMVTAQSPVTSARAEK